MKKQNNEGTNTGLPKRYFKLKNKLQFWMKYDKQICELWLVGISLIIYTIAYTLLKSCNLPSTISCLAALALVLPFTMQGFMLASMFVDARKLSLESKLLEYESEMLQKEVADDIFENSIKMSYKYLDQYYLQTRKHSQNGFFITVCVAVFGALLIFAGVIAMFLGEVKPSYVTCASGAITELIAAVFFYLYNKTVSRMSKYHNKLVLSHNVSIALKVAESLPDGDKAEAKSLIVNELLKDINTHFSKDELD